MNIQVIKEQDVLGKKFVIYGDFKNPLFLAKDVASWIEVKQASVMLNSVDEDEKVKQVCEVTNNHTTSSKARKTQEAWFLTENGLYEVLMQSRKPIAKQFKKEVKKILHEIRVNGGYPVPRNFIEALDLAKKQAMIIEAQKQEIKELTPKGEAFDTYICGDYFCNFRDSANYLHVTQQELMDLLNEKYVYKNSVGEYRCYSEYDDYMKLRPYMNQKTGHAGMQLMMTVSGLLFFSEIFSRRKKERQREILNAGREAAEKIIAELGDLCMLGCGRNEEKVRKAV